MLLLAGALQSSPSESQNSELHARENKNQLFGELRAYLQDTQDCLIRLIRVPRWTHWLVVEKTCVSIIFVSEWLLVVGAFTHAAEKIGEILHLIIT